MAAISPPHLIKRGDGFYFRRRLPKKLAGRFGLRELKVSLKTVDRRTANVRCRYLSNVFDRLMQGIEQMAGINAEQVKSLLREFFVSEWQDANEAFWCISRDKSIDR